MYCESIFVITGAGKRRERPCLYCGLQVKTLSRHLTRKHSDEELVKAALAMSPTCRKAALNQIKKDGIKKYNFDQMGLAEPTLQTERASSKLRGHFTTDVVVCDNCSGFFSRRYFYKHKRSCENSEASVVLPAGVPVNAYMKKDIDDNFKNEILARLLPDEVGRLCTSDETILAFGQHLFQKIKTKEDKKTEVRRSVMSDMRRLGSLFLNFRAECAASGVRRTVSVKDMLDRSLFIGLYLLLYN